MTFEAMAAWQAWALLAGAAGVAAGLFLLKLRAPRMPAPSLLLWSRVLDHPRELTVWERIRRAVSLAATIAVAVLLALAVVRPTRTAGTTDATAGRLLVVLDSSWSMQARTGTGETRWERAVAEAHRLFAGAEGEMALATTADGLIEGPTTDESLIDAALARAWPAGDDRTAWPRLAGAAATHFITDGAATRPLDPAVVVHSVFDPAPNVAIIAFEIRPSLSQGSAGEAYIEIANFAPAAQTVRLTLTRGATPIFDRQMEIGASGALRQVVPMARGGDAVLRGRIHAEQNALALDDEAVAWIERARPLAVRVVGPRTEWLRRAFDRNPDVEATFIDPAAFEAGLPTRGPEPDVIVFDGWAPAAAPDRPALLFAPPPGALWLNRPPPEGLPGVPVASGGEEQRPRWDVPGSHRVLLGVDPYTLVIDRARAYTSPDLVPIATSARGTPLVYVTETAGRRAVILTFGPGESNLMSAPGFPVLLANALEWLARPSPLLAGPGSGVGVPAPVKPGLIAFDPAVRTLTNPREEPIQLVRTGDRAAAFLWTPGLYVAQGSGFRSTFAINVGDPELSNLARSTSLAGGQARRVAGGPSGQPWWVYCALAAFLLATAEWWTWQRRITV